MTRLPPQPSHNLDLVAASILEPEVPAGGNEEVYPLDGARVIQARVWPD